MDLSIIIVNYKTPQLVIDCLRTVYSFPSNISFEVIVVDNFSGDQSRQEILNSYPDIHWIQMDYNAGFARANNAGIRHGKGAAVLLLNSDTLVEENAIQVCYQRLMKEKFVAAGVQLLNDDRSPQISGNFFMKGSLNNLLPLPYVGLLVKGFGKLMAVRKPNVPEATTTTEVDWINGAFLMVKREVMEKAGLMDEDFFLYAEEAEWCSRLGREGRLVIYGDLHVVHLQGESSNKAFGSVGRGYYNLSDRKGKQIMLSNFVRIRKQFGVAWLLFHFLAYTITIPVYLLAGLVHHLFRPRRFASFFKSFLGFSINVIGCWRFLPAIIRNKPYFYKVL